MIHHVDDNRLPVAVAAAAVDVVGAVGVVDDDGAGAVCL